MSTNQSQEERQFREPIAVVGSACRFPGASSSPSKLWELLSQPRDVVKEFDAERLNLKRFYHQDGDTHGATDVANKSYLLEEDSRLFDATFFGISPMEAAGMDPQQRILLETVYEVFESAGVTLEQLRGSLTSVHVGVMTSDYANIQARDTETVAKYNATGSANSIMSNRISYVFDLKGPSETIDTACSSSLVALHNAALGLLNGDCETAVVAGVNLILDPAPYINESKLHMLSPDSRSRMWDKAANGYARGEGSGAVLLKTLSKALKDGDHIEGVIRSTGVNSDGQSPGITMPFAPTQTALIRKTYARAGLDPQKDRPQYFECHGTGTPAGDPVEARAISDSFLGGEISTDNPLYVGSIKTVIGHLEGGAGLAGVLKVLLAIKHRVIPPNLLFNELNPAVAPFYGPLQIPTTAIPWPELPAGVPARASVNSFGFGGTNAHAIIESFEDDSAPVAVQASIEMDEGVLGPLVLSAKSGPSLFNTVQAYMEHLKSNPSVDIKALSSVLQTRRSTHRVRAHFSGISREAILEDMADFLAKHEKATGDNIGHVPKLVNPREQSGILGVFTGQGAQWPAMGRELIKKSPIFRRTIGQCEAVLSALPEKDRPEWSLVEELTANASTSRIAEATLSQPLCTAVQLALVNLLTESGIKFDAVVGHSSGEIGATYAAGIITLKGAMQISYYRGLHAKLASGAQGKLGGMMAAGLSLMQAREFVSRPEFEGRIGVAACNAPRTVTLSGDVDAIAEAKEELDKENIFARQLKVDTAYHSHHMLPCAKPYLESLLACDIEVSQPKRGECVWNSSVRGDTQLLRGDLSSLKGQYWVDNMVRTVLFSQAIESSIWHGGPYDLIIEVGPHPALKGPTEQTMKASYGSVPVYTGVLDRKNTDVAAFSAAVGVTWAQLGPAFVNFSGYRSAFYASGQAPPTKMIKNLPSYSWDHDKVYWREGRMSRRFRLGKDNSHELLGRRTLDDNEFELRWRNVLKLSEMPWLRGHEVLEEVLLPGASYVSIAAEAGRHLANDAGKSIGLIEVKNIEILRPVVVPDNKVGVETLFTARVIETTKDVLHAQFSYYVCPDETVGSMLQTCKGDLTIQIGTKNMPGSDDLLPPKESLPSNLTNISTEQVYSLFKGIGLNYTGAFKSITDISRCLNYANTTGSWQDTTLSDQYILHPAMLDVAFQTLFVAKAHPASRQITSALLPSHIDRVRVNPAVGILRSGETKAEFETWAISQTATSLRGDLNIYDAVSGKTFLQVEGLAVNMVGAQESSGDRSMFSKTVWGNDASLSFAEPERNEAQDAKGMLMAHAVERVALFYVKRVVNQIGPEERTSFLWYHQRMFEAFEEHIAMVKRGEHPIIEAEWLNDKPSILEEINSQYGEEVDMKLLHAVGGHLAEVVRGNEQLLEVMTKDDMLNRFYMEGYASIPTNKFIGDVMRQLTFKFPRSKILEIGAGTGGTSWSILNAIEDAYDSYTYTDISSGFFPNATEKFSHFSRKMLFKVLNVESDPLEQGFEENSYDIVVAALVLHATHDLEKTLKNARRLLKPGGYLVMMELTGITSVRATFIMGGLEGWWLGADDGRRLTPLVTAVEWDSLLQDTGFSGADTVVCDLPDESKHCTSLIVSQAIDDDFLRLREPLSFKAELPPLSEPLVIVGGKKLWTSKVISEMQKLLPRSWKRQIQIIESIDKVDPNKLSPRMDTIVLQDTDETVFSSMITQPRIQNLQSLLMNSKNMLWVTTAGKSHTPRTSIIQGITRVVPAELPHLNAQLLGITLEQTPAVAASHCVETFLRLIQSDEATTSREILWTQEPELEILADGQTVIPRVIPDDALNEMYNVSKRSISKTIDATDVAVQAISGDEKIMLQYVDAGVDAADRTKVDVRYTLHIPGCDGDAMYLIFGQTEVSSWVMTLCDSNSSVLYLDSEQLVTVKEQDGTPEKLTAVASSILAGAIAEAAIQGQSALIFEPSEPFATIVAQQLNSRYVRTEFASSKQDVPQSWIKIHSLASKRAVQKAIPHDAGIYIDCSEGTSSVAATIRKSLSSSCQASHLGADIVRNALNKMEVDLSCMVRRAYTHSSTIKEHMSSEVIAASDLANTNASSLACVHYITNWQKRDSLVLTVKPLDPQNLFRSDRTYFMAGMAGGLGLSICEWMIRNGAKNMVITSRNPKLQDGTLEEARRVGATVRVLAMDLTKKESVQAVVSEVQKTMPPIAGVCNAAMVLKDGFFIDMDAEQLNNTLSAKVLGSEHLDSVFGNTNLDFFICLGSVASVIGNVGQSNYHSANLFMTSLIQQRRARGLVGSIIQIAYVTDVGYVTREERDRQLDSHFRKVRLMPTSETDVHHAFAEAVRGGKPGSTVGGHDIIMGIEPLHEPLPLDQQPLWMKDPRFAHFAPPTSLHSQQEHGAASGAGNVKQRVEQAETEEEAVATVTEAFCGKLETMLQLAEGSINTQRPIIDLGIDSLVAVEIRTWFLKELGADIPVVKILGGDTVEQVSTLATKKLMAKILENKASQSQDDAKPTKAAPPPVPAPASTLATTKTTPPAALATPGPSRTPSPPLIIESTLIPAADKSTVVIDLVKGDDKLQPIITERALESDSANTSDTEGAIREGSSTTASSYIKIDELAVADSRSDRSSHTSPSTVSDGIKTPPEFLREQPMSPAQSRMWFVSKHIDDPAAYNMVFRYQVKGSISITRLRHALSTIAHQHEALRTCFFSRLGDGQPMQGVMASSRPDLKHLHITEESDVDREMNRLVTRDWDLENGKAFEMALLSRNSQDHECFFAYHHILMDVVGLGIIIRDLNKAYQMQMLDKNPASYLDYSSSQLYLQKSGAFDQQLSFWKAEFDTIPELLPLLPMAQVNTRPENPGNKCHHQYRELKPEQLTALKDTCQRLRVSQFHFHLANLQILLARYTGVEDICIGIVDANRADDQYAQTVGYFINMLPIRARVASNATFANIAENASRKALEVLTEAAVPFDMLLDTIKAPRSSESTPLFQAALNYRMGSIWEMSLGEAKMEMADVKDANNPFDLSLGVAETPLGCVIELYGLASLYSTEACGIILDSYMRLLDAFISTPSVSIDVIPVHPDTHVKHAVGLGTGPAITYDWAPTLSQRFMDIVHLHPSNVAVKDKTATATYAELRTRVNNVASTIIRRGCTQGSRVAVLCEPSLDFVVSMLAILHIGAVYVPMDVSLPTSRHAAMIKTCKPAMILYHEATEERVRDLEGETGLLIQEVLVDSIVEDSFDEVSCSACSTDPAVLLFTSGSTGTPKGILLSQSNFVNHLALKADLLRLGQETVLQQSSLGFDMSLIQIFCALANGGRLVVAPSELRRDPVEITSLLRSEQVSLTIATPSEYLAWLHYGTSSLAGNKTWRHACMGGERVSEQLKDEFRRLGQMGLELTNCYGPTEITAAATFQTIHLGEQKSTEAANYAVGKALPNYSVCILDTAGRPQPVEHTGEICIGGAGVALGYLDLEDETCRKFILSTTGHRMYRTGDQGRLLADGTLLCLGRMDGDTQIKLRGLRIELEEVESAVVKASDGLLSAAVVSRRGNILVAHATLAQGRGSVRNDELVRVLGRVKLPQYFIPASISVLEFLPTNANGKIDRKAIATLPLSERAAEFNGKSAPQEKMSIREGELRLLWERVLPSSNPGDRISPTSDFFCLGGNSMLLMKLQASIKETMSVAASTRVLYQASTLRDMTEAIQKLREEQAIGDAEHEIDWCAETAVPNWLAKQIRDASTVKSLKPAKVTGIDVVMTGATGFLGGHLLQSLIQSAHVRRVHCVAVLAGDEHLLPQDDKVKFYTGSLLAPTLGLNVYEREDLEDVADVIIHAGSSGHCLNTYASLRAPNVQSTQFLASMALSASIPLLFLSSNRVVLLSGNTSPPPASVARFHPSTDGQEGHMMSRWASETFLENLTTYVQAHGDKKRHWTVAVHRPSVVVSDQAPNSDALNAILRYSVSMRCVPRLDRVKGYMDLAQLDKVVAELSDAALQLALGENQAGRGDASIHFRHHSGGVKVPAGELRGHLENVYKVQFDELNMREWLNRASEAGMDPLITAYMEGILEHDAPMVFPYMGEDDA